MLDKKLIGPFKQLLSLDHVPLKGAISDQQINLLTHVGILIEKGKIIALTDYDELKEQHTSTAELIRIEADAVCVPGYIDCHTHIAFAGNRANDFALRNAGSSYLEIAESGGGIWSTVKHTRAASEKELITAIIDRANFLLSQGITTIEVKSGYGLSIQEELKILRALKKAQDFVAVDLVPTCLAAHMKPKDYEGTSEDYLTEMATHLFPVLKAEELSNRIDAFIEKSAFSAIEIQSYFRKAQALGFDITVHADQFSTAGSQVAIQFNAVSADHLEASTAIEIAHLANSNTVAVALPGASIGIGCAFTPARKLLDQGACLAIATDWNPGSAPMGQLMTQATILATAEKLSNAEVFAAITFRAAQALHLTDRGRMAVGEWADFSIYKTDNYQNITYLQGTMQPEQVWKKGIMIYQKGEQR
ncbi:imidazolonepropionase [Sphingobacterium sp. SRCM116780]|uniref:imidazolonepropionase n=1 Tax=Sphingobacterium sp. SRCM116780 TaxID=2907623 RepID=UPI001F2441A1|nr:imidazolonepropionase [Sphingobacterium sp. SRCM116780]UIR57726.1 imidazolonepropionase [Sphingobacterium sp. SRCM116780]